jgi:hypothetical protein
MNNKTKSLLMGVSMGLASVATPMAVVAQTAQDMPDDAITTPTDDQVAGTAVNFFDGIDWRWVLPVLLLVPLLLLLTRDRSDDTITYRNQRLAGTKGGRAVRRRSEVTDEAYEYPDDDELI